ncbi:sensor histidine kinase [Clostridium aminobutyricum]|uniref:histidine kinase n=1 Tax=Clostridium aminobutyricum TaxID=33953 RepID=A0A939D880_CLOAM|nr:HAMP domain-containing sensor histidine kinase [Clostridium aminobutyricum]MBN7772583.1 HAMP domain-containing histidine kinase [Clostridium aminobutyricum]
MNVSLKVKLTISYVLLSLFLVGSLLVVSNHLLEKKFQCYVIHNQEKKNQNIVHLVSEQFGENGEFPNMDMLENIGNTALSQGLILMVDDWKNNQLFCMSTLDSQVCDNMLDSMRSNMVKVYPHFNGQYVEKDYDVTKNGSKVATVTLGYYGPYFYNDEDIEFIGVLNQVLIGVGALSLIIAALLGFYMANRISKPIKKVIDQTRQIEEGNYTERLDLVSKTKETNQLIQSVNRLANTLQRQQNLQKRMARDYAHEIRTPLAALQSNLEAMIDGVLDVTPERLESCRVEILRLTKMISDIDKIVQIENDSVKLEKTQFDLLEAIHQVVSNFQQELTGQQIRIEVSTNPCEIYADRDKMIQVIINLLSNAIKYTDNGGKIQIIANTFANKTEFIVSDTGVGIEEEDLPNIFEHLYRTDKSRDRSSGGSGIGLSVVKAIIDAHGGHIEVKSQVGKGSQFIVTLPS